MVKLHKVKRCTVSVGNEGEGGSAPHFCFSYCVAEIVAVQNLYSFCSLEAPYKVGWGTTHFVPENGPLTYKLLLTPHS